jgi:hypothetical protein
MRASAVCVLLVVSLSGGSAAAQVLPEGPIRTTDGKLVVSGEVVATIGSADETAFFNYTDYEHNALRMFRMSLAGIWRPAARIALVGEVRSEDFEEPSAYAAYVRVRPWARHAFDIQAGRIPPVFGAFSRRAYNTDNPLIGYPLAYQYLTSLRADAIAAWPDDLLQMRGRGWRSTFPVGDQNGRPGIPLATVFRWDTGVQARWMIRTFELSGAVTTGTLGDPRVSDNNDGKQISGRVAVRPTVGLVLGASASRGAWIARAITDRLSAAASSHDYAQLAFGADAEYSRDYWVVRGELIWSRWELPLTGLGVDQPLDAMGAWIEGRYRITPRIFLAARLDRLGFSRIAGTLFDGVPTAWDAPVDRIEAGGGYYFQRNLVGRAVLQHNRRDAGRVRSKTFLSAQLAYWF